MSSPEIIKKRNIRQRRRKSIVVSSIYTHQKAKSIRRGHSPPEYTKDELHNWLYSSLLFNDLYEKWVKSGYNRWLKPSVDRVKDDIGYTFSNIQVMTWGENQEKAYQSMREGKLLGPKKHKKVTQYKGKEKVASFISCNEAARITGYSTSGLSRACLSNELLYKGFVWKYTKSNY